MRLISFQVERFRNIVNSEPIEAQHDVTALVGKNESGKTAILTALYRLNAAYGEEFVVSEHYPRWMMTADRKKGVIGDASPITGHFELEDDDRAAFVEKFGEGVLRNDKFEYTRGYEGNRAVLSIDEAALMENFFTRHSISAETRALFSAATSLADVRDTVAQIIEDQDEEEEDLLAELTTIQTESTSLLGKSSTWQAGVTLLKSRMPKFFYFSQYSLLPGRIDLAQLDEVSDGPAASGLQTAKALLELAGTSTESLTDDDYEERTAELEAVSNDLTSQVFEFWSQNEQLEVEIDVDKETVTTQGQYGQDQSAVARYLDIRVKDRRHGFTSNFSQRSTGFQWFFSFLAAFSEFEGKSEKVVVLLDEPGLALHAKAQADFLRFINDRLAPSAQVIYTTHSPFMIEPGHLERVRVVEDKGPKLGTTVSSDVMTVDSDTLFPLQAALGYDIAQNLFVGPDNLVVEGTSDYVYLTLISEHLKSLGRQGLDESWRVLPAGGVTNVPSFVALMGRSLDVTVFVDSGANGLQRLNNLATAGLLEAKRLITVGDITGSKNADIEDLFTPGDYLKLYNAAFGASLAVSKLQPGDRIVDRIGRTVGATFTDHGKPADYLLRNSDKLIPKFSEGTLTNFESAIVKINSTKGK